jgi:hypothetical protein
VSPSINLKPPVPNYPSHLPERVREFVEQHGVEQPGAPVPSAWRRRRNRTPHGCYQAAGRWSVRGEATYTEGVALSSVGWIPHAWLTAADGSVIDLAWDDPGETYLGVQLPTSVAARAIRQGGMFAPLLPALIDLGWTPAMGEPVEFS